MKFCPDGGQNHDENCLLYIIGKASQNIYHPKFPTFFTWPTKFHIKIKKIAFSFPPKYFGAPFSNCPKINAMYSLRTVLFINCKPHTVRTTLIVREAQTTDFDKNSEEPGDVHCDYLYIHCYDHSFLCVSAQCIESFTASYVQIMLESLFTDLDPTEKRST